MCFQTTLEIGVQNYSSNLKPSNGNPRLVIHDWKDHTTHNFSKRTDSYLSLIRSIVFDFILLMRGFKIWNIFGSSCLVLKGALLWSFTKIMSSGIFESAKDLFCIVITYSSNKFVCYNCFIWKESRQTFFLLFYWKPIWNSFPLFSTNHSE